MPREPFKGMVSGHSVHNTRTIKLEDCGLGIPLVNIITGILVRTLKGLDIGLHAYREFARPDYLLK